MSFETDSQTATEMVPDTFEITSVSDIEIPNRTFAAYCIKVRSKLFMLIGTARGQPPIAALLIVACYADNPTSAVQTFSERLHSRIYQARSDDTATCATDCWPVSCNLDAVARRSICGNRVNRSPLFEPRHCKDRFNIRAEPVL